MQRLEVSGVVRPIYGSLGVKRLAYHTHPSAHTFDTLAGGSRELMCVHTIIIIIIVIIIIISLYLFAAHNIPLQVNTDDGNMEMDISQGEVPKTNEQAENVMR